MAMEVETRAFPCAGMTVSAELEGGETGVSSAGKARTREGREGGVPVEVVASGEGAPPCRDRRERGEFLNEEGRGGEGHGGGGGRCRVVGGLDALSGRF